MVFILFCVLFSIVYIKSSSVSNFIYAYHCVFLVSTHTFTSANFLPNLQYLQHCSKDIEVKLPYSKFNTSPIEWNLHLCIFY